MKLFAKSLAIFAIIFSFGLSVVLPLVGQGRAMLDHTVGLFISAVLGPCSILTRSSPDYGFALFAAIPVVLIVFLSIRWKGESMKSWLVLAAFWWGSSGIAIATMDV